MALLNIDARGLGAQIGQTAANKAAQAVAQKMSPQLVQDVQRVLKVGNAISQTLGITNGIGQNNILNLLGGFENTATPLLGGLTLMQAKAMHDRLKAARVAKKNLFFIRITDGNPPAGSYQSADTTSLSGLITSKIGAALGTITAGISGAVGSIAGAQAGNFVGGLANGALGAAGLGANNSIGEIAVNSFDLLSMDVSYGPSLISESVQIGSGFMDRPTGRNPIELSITTMDDEAGSLKRWFEGKCEQVAHTDGTFGLPWEYLVQIEIVHAIPSAEVTGWELGYSKTMRLRPQSIQVDLSRREQAIAELPMVFSQWDSFMGVR